MPDRIVELAGHAVQQRLRAHAGAGRRFGPGGGQNAPEPRIGVRRERGRTGQEPGARSPPSPFPRAVGRPFEFPGDALVRPYRGLCPVPRRQVGGY